jgi:hypothetical protein
MVGLPGGYVRLSAPIAREQFVFESSPNEYDVKIPFPVPGPGDSPFFSIRSLFFTGLFSP